MSTYYTYERPELVAEVPLDAKKILDIGCGAGSMSAAIKQKIGADEIWGVEIVKDVAEKAKLNPALDHVLIGSIEDLINDLPENHFDCIIAGDVLEHLIDPWKTLAGLQTRLKPKGVIISSIPNIGNLSFILKLLFTGRFKYKDSGVLDRTHLRFFGRKDMIEMFEQAGFENVQANPARPKKQLIKRLGRAIFGSLIIKVFMIKAQKKVKSETSA